MDSASADEGGGVVRWGGAAGSVLHGVWTVGWLRVPTLIWVVGWQRVDVELARPFVLTHQARSFPGT